jgi:hypothetical protein
VKTGDKDEYREYAERKECELLEQFLRALEKNPLLAAKLKIALRGGL